MTRLKSCTSCGRIHTADFICSKKELSIKAYRKRYEDKQKGKKDIRFTQAWKNKANEIRQRDLGLCQMCIRSIDMLEDMKIYNYLNNQVHHIIKIKDNEDLIFENKNLITLCRYHHGLVEDKAGYVQTLQEITREQNEK